jgi:hypothetical protein
LFGLVDELGEAGDERLVAGFFGEDEESTSGEESAAKDGDRPGNTPCEADSKTSGH